MELFKNTANAFAEYLYAHGYPKNSVAFEWGDRTHAVDIAVLDLYTNMPISIYEVKGVKDIVTIRNAIAQLKRFYKEFSYPINYGVVFTKKTHPYFEYADVTEYVNGTKELESINQLNSILSESNEPVAYEGRSQSAKSSLIKEQKAKKERYSAGLIVFSWIIMPIIIAGVIILDATGTYKISSDRLIVYGLGILTALIPFIKEVKFGDYSLSLRNQKGEDQNKD